MCDNEPFEDSATLSISISTNILIDILKNNRKLRCK